MLQGQTFKMRLSYVTHLFKALTKQHHLHLVPVLGAYVPKDGVAVDIGAHAGQFTKLFAGMVPQGHVYAFEPSSYALSIIRKVVKFRGLKNVSLIPCGLSDKPAQETLRIPIKPTGSLGYGLSHLGDDAKADDRKTLQETVTLTTLDSFVKTNHLSRVDLIKADIEGWELRMLKGAQGVLEQHQPVLVIEILDSLLRRAGDSAEETFKFLESLGYKLFSYNFATGAVSPMPTNFVKGNILCLPRGKELPAQ